MHGIRNIVHPALVKTRPEAIERLMRVSKLLELAILKGLRFLLMCLQPKVEIACDDDNVWPRNGQLNLRMNGGQLLASNSRGLRVLLRL